MGPAVSPRKNLHVFQSTIPVYNATCPVILGTLFESRDIYKVLIREPDGDDKNRSQAVRCRQ